MRTPIKPALFHGILITLISLCNYFIKANDAMAMECNLSQRQTCQAQCASPLIVGGCDYNSSSGYISCNCLCSSGDEYNETTPACYWAMTRFTTCNNGSRVYCYSWDRGREVCDNASTPHLKCRRFYLFDENSTRDACSCKYYNSYTEASECYSHIYYGTQCQNTCPSGCGAQGKRSTLTPGGSITDCWVQGLSSCDSKGCYNTFTVWYTN